MLRKSCENEKCRRILVVDDNQFNIMAMRMMLEEAFNNMRIDSIPKIDSAMDGVDGLGKMN